MKAAVVPQLGAPLEIREVPVRRLRVDRHADEIDEVARDDDAPAIGVFRRLAVVVEEVNEVSIDARRTARVRDGPVVQVAPEVHVGEDEQALFRGCGSSFGHGFMMTSANPMRPSRTSHFTLFTRVVGG